MVKMVPVNRFKTISAISRNIGIDSSLILRALALRSLETANSTYITHRKGIRMLNM